MDDPLLASFLQAELSNTGTKVKIVYQERQMIPTILSDEDISLSQICNDLFPEIRKVTHSFIRDNALKVGTKIFIIEPEFKRCIFYAFSLHHPHILIVGHMLSSHLYFFAFISLPGQVEMSIGWR